MKLNPGLGAHHPTRKWIRPILQLLGPVQPSDIALDMHQRHSCIFIYRLISLTQLNEQPAWTNFSAAKIDNNLQARRLITISSVQLRRSSNCGVLPSHLSRLSFRWSSGSSSRAISHNTAIALEQVTAYSTLRTSPTMKYNLVRGNYYKWIS